MSKHLLPAVRQGNRIFAGELDDSHETIVERHKLNPASDSGHGFVPSDSPKHFLSRKAALQWLLKYDRKTFEKIKGRVPSEGLHSHIYAAAMGVVQKLTKEEKGNGIDPQPGENRREEKEAKVNLKEKRIFVFDVSGMYAYQAKRFAKDFGETLYYVPNDEDSYLMADRDEMGSGLPGVTRIYNFWQFLVQNERKDDIYFWFPDVGYGWLQKHLESIGYHVGGSKSCEELEVSKEKLHEVLKKRKMAVPPVEVVDNFDHLRKVLETTKDKWLKVGWKHRGIFETRHHKDWAGSEEWFYKTCAKIGKHRDNMVILVYDPIPSKVELAIDGWRLGQQVVPGMLTGVEEKDRGLSGMFVEEMPGPIAEVEKDIAPEFEDYNGAYGNEVRIGDDGKYYYIDVTARTGRPPGAALYTGITNVSEVVAAVCEKRMPKPEWKEKYVANILICSPVLCHSWLKVEYPESIADFVHLANHCKKPDGYYCIPDGCGETDTVAEVIGLGNTLEEAEANALKHAEMVKAEKLEFDKNVFAKIRKGMEAVKKFGIKY